MADVVGSDALAVAVDQLAEAVRSLEKTTVHLVELNQRVEQRAVSGRRASRVGAAVAFLVLIVASTGLLLARAGQSEQEGRDAQTALVIEAIQACTGPGHACYDENQTRSNQRLAPIIAVICNIGRRAGLTPEELGALCRTG